MIKKKIGAFKIIIRKGINKILYYQQKYIKKFYWEMVLLSLIFLFNFFNTMHRDPFEWSYVVLSASSPNNFIPLSFLIPIYNRAEYIYRCLDSIEIQNVPNFEIICVDDCSTDNSVELIKKRQKIDSRIKFLQLPKNSGTHLSRCQCVEMAKGEYSLSVDPDDAIHPHLFPALLNVAKSKNFDIVGYRATKFYKSYFNITRTEPFQWSEQRKTILTHDEMVYYFWRCEFNWVLWRKLIRTSLYLKAVQIMKKEITINFRNAEDMLHFGMIIYFSNNFTFFPFIGYYYFYGLPGSSTLPYNNSQLNNKDAKDEMNKYLSMKFGKKFPC